MKAECGDTSDDEPGDQTRNNTTYQTPHHLRITRRGGRLKTALLALLTVFFFMSTATPATAEKQVWSGTLTVKELPGGILGCSNDVLAGSRCSESAVLTEDEFTEGDATYAVHAVFVRSNGRLEFSVRPILPDNLRSLVLYVGEKTYDFDSADIANHGSGTSRWAWDGSALSWSAGETVSLRLTDPTSASSDATLNTLGISTGSLNETFESTTTSYTASVESGVSRITVTPAATDSSATISWLDSNGSPLADADGSTEGFQVDLSTGEKVVKIKVTAEDTTTTQTYTLTIVRQSEQGATPTVSIEAVHAKAAPRIAHPEFRVTRSASSASPLTVNLSITQAASYLSNTSPSVTIPANETSATVKLRSTYSDSTSGDITASIAAGTGYEAAAAPDDSANVAMVAADPLLIVSWAQNDYKVREGESLDVAIKATTGANVPQPRETLIYSVSARADTAGSPDDYAAISEILRVEPGDYSADGNTFSATKTVTVQTVADAEDEGDEQFGVVLEILPGSLISPTCPCRASVIITEEDISDATLSALAISPGSLNEAFAPETTSYTASVESGVARVTVTPTTSDPDASMAFFASDDTVLTDADTSSPNTFEVDLATGENVVKIKVTAEDTTTTQTYTLRVTRIDGGMLRLVDGNTPHEGRLEIFYGGQWGTICDDYWTDSDADVACRQLGFPEGSVGNGGRFLRAHFGEGAGPIHLDDLLCRGNETSLIDCPRANNNAVGVHNCRHSEDVGVRCSVGGPRISGAPSLSAPDANGRWGPGETLEVTVTFSMAVEVDTTRGVPGVGVRLGDSTERLATYDRGGGTMELVFAYALRPDDGAHTSVHVSGDNLDLRGGQIRSVASGRDALLDHTGASRAGVAGASPALTAEFRNLPDSHKGRGNTFKFELHFSAEIQMNAEAVREHLQLRRARVSEAQKLSPPSNMGWELTVSPDSFDDVVITLPATADCTSANAVCTADGQKLESGVSALVPGVPAVSVSDTQVQEGPGATLDFLVTASRAPDRLVAVRYRTVDGTARAGSDYTASSGHVFFRPGVTTRTVSIPVLDDSHDEGSETMRLELSQGSHAGSHRLRIDDGEATGTITNTDPMPKAWLARFGREAAEHVTDAIAERLRGARTGVVLGGQSLALYQDSPLPTDQNARLALGDYGIGRDGAGNASGSPGGDSGEDVEAAWREIEMSEMLLASSFHMASAEKMDSGPRWSVWGRGARSNFQGAEDNLTLDGEVTTATLGVDYKRDRWLVGVALARSAGDGSFRTSGACATGCAGEVESTLMGVYPYARYRVSERLSLWGALGQGQGDLTLSPEGARHIETEVEMRMAAAGARGVLLPASVTGGYELALRADLLVTRTTSDAAAGLAAAEAETSRIRVLLEGSREFKLGSGVLTPSLEVGLRYDGGDAETGSGLEVGGSLRYSSGSLSVEVSASSLLAHADSDYEEWGVSGSVLFAPGDDGRGLSVRVGSGWGADSGSAEQLWSQRFGGIQAGAFDPETRLDAEVGYGFDARRGLLTPYAGVAMSDSGEIWRAGARWRIAHAFDVALEASLKESEYDEKPESGVLLRCSRRW